MGTTHGSRVVIACGNADSRQEPTLLELRLSRIDRRELGRLDG